MSYQAIQHAEEDVRVQVLLAPTVYYAKLLDGNIRRFLKRNRAIKSHEYSTLYDFLLGYANLLENTKEFKGPERAAYVLVNGRRP